MAHTIRHIAKLANQLLKDCKINNPPIDPRKIASKLNIKILDKDFSEDVSGALVYNNAIPSIVCNDNHSSNRQRFTIAHELGHYILKHGREGIFIDKKVNFLLRNEDSSTGEKRQEVEANAFAAALLMPEAMVAKELQKMIDINGIDLNDEPDDLTFIKNLALKFQVSSKAMTFRIANLKLLNNF